MPAWPDGNLTSGGVVGMEPGDGRAVEGGTISRAWAVCCGRTLGECPVRGL